jgi:hypothetical protein
MGRSVTGAGETSTSLKDQLIACGQSAVPAIVGTLGFAGWVSVLGAAVVWMRFSTVGIPADQAVHDLPLGEMLVTGAVSLVLYLILGLIAVLIVYMLQGIVISQMIGSERSGNPAGRLQSELTLAEKRLKSLQDEIEQLKQRTPAPAPATAEGKRLASLEEATASVAVDMDTKAAALFKAESVDVKAPERGNQWGLMVLVAAEIVIVMLRTDISAAGKVTIGVVAAVAGITVIASAFWTPKEPAPPDPALPAAAREAAEKRQRLDAAIRAAIATLIAALAIILVVAKNWTFAPVLVAIALALANLAVGRLHPQRFFWYGISIFASVGLFGAVLTYSRDHNAPSAQPAAVLLKNGCALRGLWVGEGSERVFMARLGTAEEKPEGNGPIDWSGDGRVFWVPKADVATESVGKLQRVAAALNESGRLRGELLALNTGAKLTEKQCSEASGELKPSPGGK